MKTLIIKQKRDLTAAEAGMIRERLALEVHRNDKGPPTAWLSFPNGLYAFFELTSKSLVGIAEAQEMRRHNNHQLTREQDRCVHIAAVAARNAAQPRVQADGARLRRARRR